MCPLDNSFDSENVQIIGREDLRNSNCQSKKNETVITKLRNTVNENGGFTSEKQSPSSLGTECSPVFFGMEMLT